MKRKITTRKLSLNHPGFSLVELLAVVAVLGVLGTVMFSMLSSSLRSSRRADVLTDVQQNGNSVLTQMTRAIRYARSIEAPASCYSGPTPSPVEVTSLTIRNSDNFTTTYSCDNLPNGSISSNSGDLTDTNIAVTACSFTCTQNTAYDLPTIGISFTLNRRTASSLVENSTPLTFQTTISPRNISY